MSRGNEGIDPLLHGRIQMEGANMEKREITIVDRGRGHQLSTCRITILDLVPYFQEENYRQEIACWIPTLSDEEVAVAERFYREHREEFDEKDRRARERREEQIRVHRQRFPELQGKPEEHLPRLRKLLERRLQGKNGERHPG